nr:immunoglobulin heavy chain junction region [Macaca mulatta]
CARGGSAWAISGDYW